MVAGDGAEEDVATGRATRPDRAAEQAVDRDVDIARRRERVDADDGALPLRTLEQEESLALRRHRDPRTGNIDACLDARALGRRARAGGADCREHDDGETNRDLHTSLRNQTPERSAPVRIKPERAHRRPGGDLPALVLGGEPVAEILVHLLELVGRPGSEEAASRRARDPLQLGRLHGDGGRLGDVAGAGNLLEDGALRRAERHGVDRDAQLARGGSAVGRLQLAGVLEPVGQQEHRRRRVWCSGLAFPDRPRRDQC